MKRYVQLECGHEFHESCPDGAQESSPRVCSYMDHKASDPGVLWMTDQGMAMSNVEIYSTVRNAE